MKVHCFNSSAIFFHSTALNASLAVGRKSAYSWYNFDVKNLRRIYIFASVLLVAGLLVAGFFYVSEKNKQSQIIPSINITSPGSKDSWITGSTHMITWESKNISTTSKISITLRRIPPPPLQTEGQEFDPIVFVNLDNNGKIDWNIFDTYPTGTYIMGINAYTSIPVNNPVIAESAPFKIIHWDVYTNGKENYSFEYPKEWNVATNKYNFNNVLFGPGATSESGYGGVEFLGTLSPNQSLKDFVKSFNSGVEGDSVSETETIINGQTAIVSILPKASTEPTEVKSVSFEKDGKVFNMYLMYKTNLTQYPDDEKRLDIFNQMISTFKFIENTSTLNSNSQTSMGLANPASVNCSKLGGNLVINTRGDGGQYGLCYFEDNRACEEWALMRGECPVGGVKTTGFDTIDQNYCAWSGGQTLAVPNSICTFKNGSTCSTIDFYNGKCSDSQ